MGKFYRYDAKTTRKLRALLMGAIEARPILARAVLVHLNGMAGKW